MNKLVLDKKLTAAAIHMPLANSDASMYEVCAYVE